MKNSEMPVGAVMAKEVAEIELTKWFDLKRVKESARSNADDEGNDYLRDKLIDGFMYGNLVVEDNGTLIQTLEDPIVKEDGGVLLDKLTYPPRVKRNALTEPMKGVKPNDMEGKTQAWISGITGKPKGQIASMDLSDFSLAESLITYFLK